MIKASCHDILTIQSQLIFLTSQKYEFIVSYFIRDGGVFMEWKLTTLIENHEDTEEKYVCEHGFSILI